MDPSEPVAGLSLERYAELSAEIAAARGDAAKIGEVLGGASLALADWERAHAGWSARLSDPAIGDALAGPFETRYHATLDKLLGPAPDVPPPDFAAMLGEALAFGLPGMGQRRGVDPLAWSRIWFHARAGAAEEPGRLPALLALAGQIAERCLRGDAPPHAAKDPGRVFDKDAHVAARAVGKAVVSGLDAFGSALDSASKSLFGPSVGAHVIVRWSDGKEYPGTVAQAGKGQVLVTMTDGTQHWIPEAFVKAV